MPAHHRLTSAFLPTAQQELLIRAAVRANDAAVRAWEHWSRTTGDDPLDSGSERLLPLVHRNLLRFGVDDPRLRAAYQRTASANELLFRAARPLLRRLQDAGVRTMLLKGAALARLVYRNDGVRPMGDIDVLVPHAQAPAAFRMIRESDWRPDPPLRALGESYFARHAYHFRNSHNLALDLHWRMFLDSARGAEADDEVWNGCAAMILEDGTATATPCAADLFFHICVHGARWSRMSPIRWVTDALAILGDSELTIDWNRFLRQGKLRRLRLPIRAAVGYLCARFDAPVPAHVRAELREWRGSRLERIEYDLWLRGTPALGPARMVLFHGLRYARLTEGSGIARRIAGFPRYLEQLWDAPGATQLPRIALSKSLARLRKDRDSESTGP